MYKKLTLGALIVSALVLETFTVPAQATNLPPSVVFASNRDGRLAIYTSTRDGSNTRRLTHNTTEDKEPTVSPDSTQIVFATTEDDNDWEATLTLLDLQTNQQTQLTSSNKIDYRMPVWSPDGQQIAFTSIDTQTSYESCINVMTVKTKVARKVTCASVPLLSPDWSPDGTKLVFDEFNRQTGGKIYTIGIQPGAPKQFITDGSSAAFSPEGDYIAFSGYDTAFDTQIFIAKADGSSVQQITTGSEIKTVTDWADDQFITYAAFGPETGGIQVKSIKPDGGPVLAIPHKGGSFELPGKGLLFAH